jgi:hypothetical protein
VRNPTSGDRREYGWAGRKRKFVPKRIVNFLSRISPGTHIVSRFEKVRYLSKKKKNKKKENKKERTKHGESAVITVICSDQLGHRSPPGLK